MPTIFDSHRRQVNPGFARGLLEPPSGPDPDYTTPPLAWDRRPDPPRAHTVLDAAWHAGLSAARDEGPDVRPPAGLNAREATAWLAGRDHWTHGPLNTLDPDELDPDHLDWA